MKENNVNFKLPDLLMNDILNKNLAKMQPTEKDAAIMFKTFEIVNEFGIPTEKWLELMGNITRATHEIEEMYKE